MAWDRMQRKILVVCGTTATGSVTVPTGERWVLRELLFMNGTSGAHTAALNVDPGSGSVTLIKKPCPPNDTVRVELLTVVYEGEVLSCSAEVASVVRCILSVTVGQM